MNMPWRDDPFDRWCPEALVSPLWQINWLGSGWFYPEDYQPIELTLTAAGYEQVEPF